MDKPRRASKKASTVPTMRDVGTEIDNENFRLRLRALRMAKGLTLFDVEQRSSGQITAVALGSYERGDRNITLAKLFDIARIYNIPSSELFVEAVERIEPGRITVDLRKLTQIQISQPNCLIKTFKSIAAQRGDWNGEVLSIRASDLSNLYLFSGLSYQEIQSFISECTVPRLK